MLDLPSLEHFGHILYFFEKVAKKALFWVLPPKCGLC